jgi:hypothetical protein
MIRHTMADGIFNNKEFRFYPTKPLAESDATVCRIRFPPEADSKRQGKLGPDVGAP